jgi:inorganic phosphate transporter, PiT family
MLTLIFTVIIVALIFEYINGFHDTANSIATVIGTKALTATQAIILAAVGNLVGSFLGKNVVKTVSSGLLDGSLLPGGLMVQQMIICALIGGIIWNLLTWWFGLPSSSTHALVGGMAGAGFAMAHGNVKVLIWDAVNAKGEAVGYLHKVVYPMLTSPVCGVIIGLVLGYICLKMAHKFENRLPRPIAKVVRLIGPGYLAVAHGMSDAQKTAGIITMGLIAGTSVGGMPQWMQVVSDKDGAPFWVRLACAIIMGAGTAAGGWRIIKTLGEKLVPLKPAQGFAAETTAASLLAITQHFGMTVSTTHVISTAIMGAGMADGADKLDGKLVRRILGAWVLTIPAAALMGGLCVLIGRAVGLIG